MLNTQQLEKNLAFFAQYLMSNEDFSINFSKKDFNVIRDNSLAIEKDKEVARLYILHNKKFRKNNFPNWLEKHINICANENASKKVPTIESLKNYKLVTIDFVEYFEIKKNGETITAKRYWYKLNRENYKKWREILKTINTMED